MRRFCMKRIGSLLLVSLLLVVLFAVPTAAQSPDNQPVAVSPLVKLLQAKGILTTEEVNMVSHASSPSEADQRLGKLLLDKGIISSQDYAQTYGTPTTTAPTTATVASTTNSANARYVPAVMRTVTGMTGPTEATLQKPLPKDPPIIPAVAPLRVLPIDIPKQGGLIPDIKLGSGASMKIYGFFKA